MKTTNRSLLFVIALSISTAANAGGAMLRVTCEGDDVGAEVLINGKFKGECPMDVQVPAGTSKLLVQKKIGDEDRIFEQDIRMGDGGVKKIEVRLVDKAFLLNIKKAEAGDIRSLKILTLTYKRNMTMGKGDAKQNAEQLFKWTRRLAEVGEEDSMLALGEAYEDGIGVEVSSDEAKRWYSKGLAIIQRKADSGDNEAMVDLGIAYRRGRGVQQNNATALLWLNKAKEAGNPRADQLIEIVKKTP